MNQPQREPSANPNLALVLHFLLQLLPFAASAFTLYLGYELYIQGVSGTVALAPEPATFQDQLINATPGLLFAIGGFVALLASILRATDGPDISRFRR